MIYVLATVVLLLCILDYVYNFNKNAMLLKKIPGGKHRFLIGNALEIFTSPVKIFYLARSWAQNFGTIYRYQAFSILAVNIYTPDDIEVVTSGMKHHEKSIIYEFMRPWLQSGLLLSDGQKWHQRRKVLTNAFHFNVLRQYFVVLEENNKRLVETFNKKRHDGDTISIIPVISEYALNSICESAMGTEVNKDAIDKCGTYKRAIYGIINMIIHRFVRIYLHPKIFFDLSPSGRKFKKYLSAMHDFTDDVIMKRKEAIKHNEIQRIDLNNIEKLHFTSKKKNSAMLDLLIFAEEEGFIDKEGIQEEVDTFMFEGHDTVTAGLTYTVMLIANNPDIQDSIVDELQNIFGETMRATTMEDLSKMQYLERCIKESLRLYPPVPFIGRKLSEDVKLSNYTVPAGTLCHIHIYDLHRRADLYENPLKFDPDRFLPENCAKRHPFAYIPFSAGPRNCIDGLGYCVMGQNVTSLVVPKKKLLYRISSKMVRNSVQNKEQWFTSRKINMREGQKFAMMEMKSAVATILRNFELQEVTTSDDLEFKADLVLRNSKPVYVKFVERRNKI